MKEKFSIDKMIKNLKRRKNMIVIFLHFNFIALHQKKYQFLIPRIIMKKSTPKIIKNYLKKFRKVLFVFFLKSLL